MVLALVLSVLAMIGSNNYRGILQFSTIRPSPRRRISTIDSYIEGILDDANIENSTLPIIDGNHTLIIMAENASIPAYQIDNTTHRITPKYDRKVFLMDAYLMDDRLIRITTISKCKSKTHLIFCLRFNVTTFAIHTNSQPIQACPWYFAKKCDFVGYFMHLNLPKVIMLPLVSESMPEAFVSIEGVTDTRHRVRLYDARAKKATCPHELAVCLQPILLLADWTILIQFFEVVSAVNDCVLRSRGEAKYVVSSDLDEIIVPFHSRSFLSLLHSLKKASPTAAAFIFLSSYVMFEIY